MTIGEIADKLFETAPLYANNSVASAIRQINRKCEYHKLKWFINGMGIGRNGRTVWRDKV